MSRVDEANSTFAKHGSQYPRLMLPLLAHQGGWDEILMFVAPIALAFFVIRALERRGTASGDGEEPTRDKDRFEHS